MTKKQAKRFNASLLKNPNKLGKERFASKSSVTWPQDKGLWAIHREYGKEKTVTCVTFLQVPTV